MALSERVQGSGRGREVEDLFRHCYELPEDAVVVEVGSFCGSSTILLAGARKLRRSGIVHCVGRLNGQFDRNIRAAGLHRYVWVHGDTPDRVGENWSTPIDLLYLDAALSHLDALVAYRRFAPRLKAGGVIGLRMSGPRPNHSDHDGHWRLLLELIRDPDYADVETAGATTFARRTSHTAWTGRAAAEPATATAACEKGELSGAQHIERAGLALAWGDVASLAAALVRFVPHDPERDFALQIARFAVHGGALKFAPLPRSAIFLQNIGDVWRTLQSGSAPVTRRARQFIGAEFDFLGEIGGVARWSIPQCLNFLMQRRLCPAKRAAVVGTMRDDGIYVLEWIAYYLALGFDAIFLYTNDNSDGSEILLRSLADARLITLIESGTKGTVQPEVKAYEHSIQLLPELRDFEWVLYVDSDEFLVPAPKYKYSITAVLDALAREFPRGDPAGVCYAWRWVVSGMVYSRKPGMLIERFQYARPHWITKSLVRLSGVLSMQSGHHPDCREDAFLVDSAFERMPQDVKARWNEHNPQYAGGWINHYWPKSFEEFAIKKARGASLRLAEGQGQNFYDRPFRQFFEWNGEESVRAHCPVDPSFVERVRALVQELRATADVAEIADRIECGFPTFVAELFGGERGLRELYERNRVAPTGL